MEKEGCLEKVQVVVIAGAHTNETLTNEHKSRHSRIFSSSKSLLYHGQAQYESESTVNNWYTEVQAVSQQ